MHQLYLRRPPLLEPLPLPRPRPAPLDFPVTDAISFLLNLSVPPEKDPTPILRPRSRLGLDLDSN